MMNIYEYTHPNGKIGKMKAQSIDELKQKIAEINGWDYGVSNIKHIGASIGYTMGGGLRGNKNNGAHQDTFYTDALDIWLRFASDSIRKKIQKN